MKVRQIRQRAKTKYVTEGGFAFLRGCFAKRCRTYEAGCALCDEWRFRDEMGRFVYNFAELRDYMKTTEGANKCYVDTTLQVGATGLGNGLPTPS